jgi:hypothetical protein
VFIVSACSSYLKPTATIVFYIHSYRNLWKYGELSEEIGKSLTCQGSLRIIEYIEGSCLSQFLWGEIYLERPYLNKILIAVNKADWQSINAVSGARATICSNVEIVELEKPWD